MSDEAKKPRRTNGEGTLMQRGKSKIWTCQITDRPGHTVQWSSGTTVKAEAVEQLTKRKESIRLGVQSPQAIERLTVEDLLAAKVRDYRVKNLKTLRDAERMARTLGEFFGKMRAVVVCNADAQRYIEERRRQGIADATTANELHFLKAALHVGRKNHKGFVPPEIDLPTGYDHPRQGFLEPAQFRALMSHLPENLRPLVCLAFYSGARRGELLSLRWSQVDLAEGIIRLSGEDTKTGEPRTIPIAAEPLAMLRMSRLQRDQQDPRCDAVFFRERRRNVDGQGSLLVPLGDFGRAWTEACGKAGLPGLIFHDLRRSGVRQLIRSGVNENTAMAISGHKTRSVFQRYNIVSLDDLREATRKQDAHLAVPAPEQQAEVPAPETVN